MKVLLAALILFFTVLSTSSAQIPQHVVTIYFSGTAMESDMWKRSRSAFGRPESIALLHHFQNTGADFPNQHKAIVEGFSGLWDKVKPDWNENFELAINSVKPIFDAEDCRKCIVLNLVGFSRGAVSTMHLAHKLDVNPAYAALNEMIERINILVFDPVPGDPDMSREYFILPNTVASYIGFYSEDERSLLFSPVFPVQLKDNVLPGASIHFFSVPGSHETMVGSTKTGGHAHDHDLAGIPLGNSDNEELLDHLSATLKIVATEIMGSPQWGRVSFGSDPDADLNLDWRKGETSRSVLKEKFENSMEAIYREDAVDYYANMREESFVVFTEAWSDSFFSKASCKLNSFFFPSSNGSRCAYLGPYESGKLEVPDGAIDQMDDLTPLNKKNESGYIIWGLLEN